MKKVPGTCPRRVGSVRLLTLTLTLLVSALTLGLTTNSARGQEPAKLIGDGRPFPSLGAFLESPGRILFLGDSITHAGHYISVLETYFRQRREVDAGVEWINLGLPSETCTGLSEPPHPFPRPNVHERLDRALEKIAPDVVIACYGMNDAIYHPFDDARFEAYQEGITTLVEKAKATGAYVILLTPPAFDPLPMQRQGKLVPEDAESFAWHTIYEGYADVIQRYADWVLTQEHEVDMVIDIHTPIAQTLAKQRESNPDYAMSNDGVHMDEDGHRIIAEAILEAWGKPGRSLDPALYSQLSRRQSLMHAAWLSHVGHVRPGMKPGLPLEEAEAKARGMNGVIATLIANAPQQARFRSLEDDLAQLAQDVDAAQLWLGDRFVHLIFPPSETPVALQKGADLSNWEGDTQYWSVEADGTIRGANDEPVPSSTYLFTKQSYREFRLIFEVRQTMSPNHSTMHSAVAALGERFEDKGPNAHGFRGPLLMFCHDWGIWDAYRRNRVEPAGQRGPLDIGDERKGDWNLVEFLVVGNRIQCAANGVKIFDFTDSPEMLKASPIGLQLHSNQRPQEFRFRHLYLAENPQPELTTVKIKRVDVAP